MAKNNTPENDEHIIHLWEPLKFNVESGYDYLRRGKFKSWLYRFLRGVIRVVFTPICWVMFDFKLEGKENIEKIKNTGAVSIMNHINFIDCVLVALAMPKQRIYFVTLESNFRIPLACSLIRALGAVPLSGNSKTLKELMDAMYTALGHGDVVHMYPEGVLYPYCNELRKFKTGAFHMAVKTGKPVLPMVLIQRKPAGLRGIFKRKPCLTLKILPPIESKGKKQEELMQECRAAMKAEL